MNIFSISVKGEGPCQASRGVAPNPLISFGVSYDLVILRTLPIPPWHCELISQEIVLNEPLMALL